MSWDGIERRKMNQEDHDLLTRIDNNLTTFMKRFDEHEKLDNRRFTWFGIAILIIAASTGVLPQILAHFKIGA